MGDTMLNLYVLDAVSSKKVPAEIDPASKEDFAATHDWQTNWESTYARQLPNKVALHREDNYELLGLMSYELDERGLAVEVLYMESARHSNANLLHATGEAKRYIGIAKAMLHMPSGFPRKLDLTAYSFLRRKRANYWNTICANLARGRSGPMIRSVLFFGKTPQKRSFLNIGGMNMNRSELLHAEESGAASGWVSRLSQEDREYFAYLRKVFKRYNITPSKATRLEYDFVIRVAESEFYLQKANA